MRGIHLLLLALTVTGCAHLPGGRPTQVSSGSEIFAVPDRRAGEGDGESAEQARIPRDILVPGWIVEATQVAEDRFRLDLRMRTLITGGDGEAREVFMRGARDVVDTGGYVGFDIVRFEERIDSGFLFGRRSASGEIRVVRSRTWGL